MNVSRSVLLVHRWAGLASCAFLVVIAITGSVLVYAEPINRMLVPAMHRIEPRGGKRPLSASLDAVRALHPQDPPFSESRGAPDQPDVVLLKSFRAVTVNPYSGAVIGERTNRNLVGAVSSLHGHLLAGTAGHVLVGVAGLIALLEAGTGLIRWWRYRTFWITRRATTRRVIFELHNASGFWAAALVILLSLTGVMFSFDGLFERVYRHFERDDATLAVRAPGDSTTVTGPDAAAGIALAARPGEFVTVLFPRGAGGPWTVGIRVAGDHSPRGRVQVSVDSRGGVVAIRDGGPGQLGARLTYWRDGIHSGWILGGFGMLLAAIGGVLFALQSATGFLVWWKPR